MFKSFWQSGEPLQDNRQQNIQLQTRVKEMIDVTRAAELPSEELFQQILSVVHQVSQREKIAVDTQTQQLVANSLMEEIQGISPISEIWNDPDVTELFAHGTDYLRVKRNGQWECSAKHFTHELQLQQLISNFARQLGSAWKADDTQLTGQLSDGTHFHAGRCHTNTAFSLKKQPNLYSTIEDWVSSNALTWEMAEFLITAMEQQCNIVIAGSETVHSTKLLQALYQSCDQPQRLVARIDCHHSTQTHANTVHLPAADSRAIIKQIRQARNWNADHIFCSSLPASAVTELLETMQTGVGCTVAIPLKDGISLFDRLAWMLACENVLPGYATLCSTISASIDLLVEVQTRSSGIPTVTRIAEIRSDSDPGIVEHDIFIQRPNPKCDRGLFYATGTEPVCLSGLFTPNFYQPRELGSMPVVPGENPVCETQDTITDEYVTADS